MKRPWYYEDGVWKNKGTVDWRELNEWATFYGHDLQGALALADEGKIPMWFTLAYSLERLGSAQGEFKRAFVEAFEPIVNALEGGLERIMRSFRGERIP